MPPTPSLYATSRTQPFHHTNQSALGMNVTNFSWLSMPRPRAYRTSTHLLFHIQTATVFIAKLTFVVVDTVRPATRETMCFSVRAWGLQLVHKQRFCLARLLTAILNGRMMYPGHFCARNPILTQILPGYPFFFFKSTRCESSWSTWLPPRIRCCRYKIPSWTFAHSSLWGGNLGELSS